MRKLVTTATVVAIAALGMATVALATARVHEYMLGAKLDPMADHAKGAPHAKGAFIGTLKGNKLTWRLTFKKLSGLAVAARIHAGKAGKTGPVLIPLCKPCKSGAHGTKKLNAMEVRDLRKSGSTYVNVRTKRNPHGEIRGQIASHM